MDWFRGPQRRRSTAHGYQSVPVPPFPPPRSPSPERPSVRSRSPAPRPRSPLGHNGEYAFEEPPIQAQYLVNPPRVCAGGLHGGYHRSYARYDPYAGVPVPDYASLPGFGEGARPIAQPLTVPGDKQVPITVKSPDGRDLVIWVSPSDTIESVKARIQDAQGLPPAQQQLVFDGKELDDFNQLSSLPIFSYGINSLSPRTGLSLILPGAAAQALGLTCKAYAVAIWPWDGILLGERKGLRLRRDEVITIGRVIDPHWLQGYYGTNECGYIPRNYIKVTGIVEESIRPQLGEEALTAPLRRAGQPPLVASTEIAKDSTPGPAIDARWTDSPVKEPASRLRLCKFFRSHAIARPETPAANDIIPEAADAKPVPTAKKEEAEDASLPPPLFPTPFLESRACRDRLEDGSRIRILFQLDKGSHTLKAVLSCIAAPRTRICSATVRLEFVDGQILSIEPTVTLGPDSKVDHSEDKAQQASVSVGTGNSTPATVSAGVSASASKHTEYERHTYSRIVGDGVGTRMAYWVLTEDPGQAGRHGLDPQADLSVHLTVHPTVVIYETCVTVVDDVSGEGTTPRWLNMREFRSGSQRAFFS